MSQTQRNKIREAVRDQIVEALATLPAEASWRMPWRRFEIPMNASTGRTYSGINMLTLTVRAMALGVSGGGWLTYRQAQALGGQVRRGEKGTKCVKYTPWKKKGDGSEDEEVIPVLKGFTVFHVSQCDGLEAADLHLVDTGSSERDPDDDFSPAHELVRLRDMGMVELRVGGDVAAYAPDSDRILMPAPERFARHADWWRVYLHELVHATGHVSRLNRAQSTRFGSRTYAFEELVAELGSALLSHNYGVTVTDTPGEIARDHAREHAAYIASWIEVLRDDASALFDAWALALGACDWLELEFSRRAASDTSLPEAAA